MDEHAVVVSHDQWVAARRELLAKEKEFTRAHDRLLAARRALPWERVRKEYVFDTVSGPRTLAQLFADRSQLVVYHFMFDPEWDEGCPHCSFWADTFDHAPDHLAQLDIRFLAISRAPLEKITEFRRRMGWSFDWVSSHGTDFNHDFNVHFTPDDVDSGTAMYNFAPYDGGPGEREGISVFARDESGQVYRTYSAFARGIDIVNGTYQFVDMTPRGRWDEDVKGPQWWVRHRDRYGAA